MFTVSSQSMPEGWGGLAGDVTYVEGAARDSLIEARQDTSLARQKRSHNTYKISKPAVIVPNLH